jgi:two-component system heavy metal sensor histidine kinase CusS
MQPRSLSFHLTLHSVLVSFFVFIVVWSALYISVQRKLESQDQEVISDRLRTISNLLNTDDGHQLRLQSRVEREWAERKFERVFVRVLTPDGIAITQSPDLPTQYPEIFNLFVKNEIPIGTEKQLTRFESHDGVFQIVVARTLSSVSGSAGNIVQIALDRTGEENLLQTFRQSLFFLLTFGIFGCFWTSRFTVLMALKSIRNVSQIATTVNSASLKERINPSHLPKEFHELASTLNAMLDRLEESFERVSDFSANMAHEIRTPVNNMLGTFGVALGRPRSPEEYHSLILSGVEECERLRRIIESLLFIARSTNPSQELNSQPFLLSEELDNILSFYEISAHDAGVELELKLKFDPMIYAERNLFQRAIGNLLSNAIRHSPSGSKVCVEAELIGERVQISVTDHGCGIDALHLSRVGERFFRIDPSRSKASGGTGLGLSIVQSIAKIHCGQMKVESHVGAGTKVTLDFPASPEPRL